MDESTDEDAELMQVCMKDVQEHGSRVFSSSDKVDRRLVKIYKTKREAEDRKRNKKNLDHNISSLRQLASPQETQSARAGLFVMRQSDDGGDSFT